MYYNKSIISHIAAILAFVAALLAEDTINIPPTAPPAAELTTILTALDVSRYSTSELLR